MKKWLDKSLKAAGLFIFAFTLVLAAVSVTSLNKEDKATKAPQSHTLAVTDVNLTDLYNLTNQDRLSAGLTQLKLNPDLAASAQDKCADMTNNNYYEHTSPMGVQWYTFIDNHTKSSFRSENLDERTVEANASEVNSDWMNSPGHKANILNPHFTDIGFATCTGILNGLPSVRVVQHFIQAYIAPLPAPAPSAGRQTKCTTFYSPSPVMGVPDMAQTTCN